MQASIDQIIIIPFGKAINCVEFLTKGIILIVFNDNCLIVYQIESQKQLSSIDLGFLPDQIRKIDSEYVLQSKLGEFALVSFDERMECKIWNRFNLQTFGFCKVGVIKSIEDVRLCYPNEDNQHICIYQIKSEVNKLTKIKINQLVSCVRISKYQGHVLLVICLEGGVIEIYKTDENFLVNEKLNEVRVDEQYIFDLIVIEDSHLQFCGKNVYNVQMTMNGGEMMEISKEIIYRCKQRNNQITRIVKWREGLMMTSNKCELIIMGKNGKEQKYGIFMESVSDLKVWEGALGMCSSLDGQLGIILDQH